MEKINQPEGLHLMWYQCEECGHRERLWNSRPRVTPFTINCIKCKGEARHADWNLDEYAPNHIPQKGERVFIDWSRDSAERHYQKLVEGSWTNGEYPMSEMHETKEEALESLMKGWQFGEPAIEII